MHICGQISGTTRIERSEGAHTSSTSGSILTFGSMLETRSCIDRRKLWSPGVFFRRARPSSSGNTVESSGFAICGGAPDIRPLGIPPVNDGRPCWAACHCTGPC